MRLIIIFMLLSLGACSENNQPQSSDVKPAAITLTSVASEVAASSGVTAASGVFGFTAASSVTAVSSVDETSNQASPTTITNGANETEDEPSQALVMDWWKKKSSASVGFSNIEQIRLKSHELAYLASATFDDQGRNGMFGAVLIRPKLQEVQDVSDWVGSEFEIYDLDNDGVSEVLTKVSGSGGGTEIGDKLIVLFDEWKPIVLHQVHFETGLRADLTAGTEETIDWKLVPKSDSEKYAKLIEAINIDNWTQGHKDKHPKHKIQRNNNTYKFINKKFEKEGPSNPPAALNKLQ